jgi:hypothetical protein
VNGYNSGQGTRTFEFDRGSQRITDRQTDQGSSTAVVDGLDLRFHLLPVFGQFLIMGLRGSHGMEIAHVSSARGVRFGHARIDRKITDRKMKMEENRLTMVTAGATWFRTIFLSVMFLSIAAIG